MLVKWASDASPSEISAVVEKTKGYSGAHLHELCAFAKTLCDDEGIEIGDALLRAIEKIETQRELIDQVQASGGRYPPHKERQKAIQPIPSSASTSSRPSSMPRLSML